MDFRSGIAAALETAGISPGLLEIPPDSSMGDFALPCFSLAKERKQAPAQIAQQLADEIIPPDFVADMKAVGPYVNFTIKPEALIEASFEAPSFEKNGKTVVVEYSSPNIAKPFGIGHLRSTVIGAALHRTYAYAGWKAIGLNHPGDWGTQFGKLIVAYRRWPIEFGEEPIKDLLALYVKFHEEAEKDPTLEEAARAEFKKLEEGDEENTRLWTLFKELSFKEFNKIYARLGVGFDAVHGESFYSDKMQAVVDELRAKGLLEESEGAQVVTFDDPSISAPAIILKSDGATMYITRDLAAALYRKETYAFDKMLYEVGSEQKLHFMQLFATLKKLGREWADACEHVYHGLYRFPEGKMSTRKGRTIFVEDVLDKAVELSLETIKEKNPELDEKERIAEQVGVGAIVFNDLKNDRIRDILFDWDEILDFEGESGPYLQYTHARLRSILRKSDESPVADAALLTEEDDVALARKLLEWTSVIEQVTFQDKPHLISHHLLQLAQLMNSHYQKHRVIQDDKALERARLAQIEAVADRLKLGLGLLGISAPDQM